VARYCPEYGAQAAHSLLQDGRLPDVAYALPMPHFASQLLRRYGVRVVDVLPESRAAAPFLPSIFPSAVIRRYHNPPCTVLEYARTAVVATRGPRPTASGT
jgi:hypothetical protein